MSPDKPLDRVTRSCSLLADAMRLRVLAVVADGDAYECQVAAALCCPAAEVRAHLDSLVAGGLLECSFSPEFECLRWEVRSGRPAALAAVQAARADPRVQEDLRRAARLRVVGPAALCRVRVDLRLEDRVPRAATPGALPCGCEPRGHA